MRRLAPLLILAIAAAACADSGGYLRMRAQRGIFQAASPAALRETAKPRVLELAGKPVGTCQAGDTTVLILQMPNGDTQEIEAKAMPDWLAMTSDPVRALVRSERINGSLRVTLLAAAPEIDVLPAEEAYWRALAQKRRIAKPVASRSAAPRGVPGNPIYGAIGRRSYSRARSVVPTSGVLPLYAAFIQGQNPRLPSGKADEIARDLVRFSLGYGVDARLVLAILMVESGFDPNAVSHSGAVGLGQLMPATARWMGVRNAYDTTENLYGMIKLLNTHSRQFGRDPWDPIVLAAYNAGEGAVRRHGGVPPYRETQAYVLRVTRYFHALRGY